VEETDQGYQHSSKEELGDVHNPQRRRRSGDVVYIDSLELMRRLGRIRFDGFNGFDVEYAPSHRELDGYAVPMMRWRRCAAGIDADLADT
jgi:hypothetical protein